MSRLAMDGDVGFAKRGVDRALVQRALHAAEGIEPAELRLRRVCHTLQQALLAAPTVAAAAMPTPYGRERLSERQMQTLQLVAQGLSNRRIARRMDLAEDAVKGQVRGMLDKLNMPNRTALALWAVREGLVSLHAD